MADLIRFTEHLALGGFNYAFGISAVDLTGNGVPDLVTADTEVGLYWLELILIEDLAKPWSVDNKIADVRATRPSWQQCFLGCLRQVV